MQYFGFDRPSFGIKTFGFGANFDPLDLFAGGKQGAWYDPSDLTTLYQDAVMLVPVTASGDPVGARLDLSKGLVPTVLPVTTSNISNPITLPANGNFNILSTNNTPKGMLKIEVEITGGVSQLSLFIDGNGAAFAVVTSAGKYTFTVNNTTPTSSNYASLYIRANTTAQTFKIESVKISKIEGNHAVQTVSSARPIYQTDGAKSWLYHDKVDDKMTVNLPAMTATVVTATDAGVTINYPVSITAGNYVLTNNSTLGRDYGRLIIDRELTVAEQTQITNYFNVKRGV